MYRKQLIVNDKPKSPIAEAYRAFRTNLQYSKVDGQLKSILFTSSGPGEGKSVTAANTAIALAQGGAKVVILDCDLRRPVQHLIFGRVAMGITNVLAGNGTLADYVQDTDITNLKILTSGPIPPNPSELLNSSKMIALLATLAKQFDYLILDTPPILPVTDTCVLASKVDGVIMVIGAGVVRPAEAQRAAEAVRQVKGNILGMMINRVKNDEILGDYYNYCNFHSEVKKTVN
jgi:capsular exopolysaccharide synthesis family protein